MTTPSLLFQKLHTSVSLAKSNLGLTTQERGFWERGPSLTKWIPSTRGNSICKDPEKEMNSVCLRDRKVRLGLNK